MGGGASSASNAGGNDDALENNARKEAVEEFVEQAYVDSSKTDGLHIILSNPRGRAAFIKFLNTENGSENLQFFQDLEKVRRTEDSDLAADAKALVATYKVSDAPTDAGLTDNVSASAESILSKQTAGGGDDDLMTSVFNASNETLVMMALNVFPNFIGSESYKTWREEEAKAVVEAKALPVTASPGTIIDPAITAVAALADQSATYVKPELIGNLFRNDSWLGTLISAAEGLPICVTLADARESSPGFPLIYVNRVFEAMTLHPREAIRGTNCKFLQHKDLSEKDSISALSSALANAQPVKVAITNVRRDGTPFKNLLAMKPIFDLDGKYVYVVGVQFDISAPGSNAKAMKLVDSLITLLPNTIPAGGPLDGRDVVKR
eukprot:gene1967-3820_t